MNGCQKNGKGVCLSQSIKTKGMHRRSTQLQKNKANEPHNESMGTNY